MTKERLQQHIDNFNQMCSELDENTRITIFIKDKAIINNSWHVNLNKSTCIDGAELTQINTIKIGKDGKHV